MTSEKKKGRRKWPRGVKILIALALLILIPTGVVHFLGRASQARWQRYADRLRARGEPLTFEEIAEKRTRIPDDRNSALVIQRLRDDLKELGADRPDPKVLVFARRSSDAGFFQGIPRGSVEVSRRFRAAHEELLDKLSVIRDMPAGRLDPVRSSPASSILEMLLPNLAPIRAGAKLVRLDAMLKLIDGDLTGAADSARLQSAIGATLNEHPTLIGRLVQIAVAHLALQTMEDTLRVGSLDDAALRKLMQAVDAYRASGGIKWALWGERAFLVGTCAELAAGKLSVSDLESTNAPPVNPSFLLPDYFIFSNEIRGAEMYSWLIDAADDPVALVQAARRIDREIPKLSVTDYLVKILFPSLSRAVELNTQFTAELRCSLVGLAAERFRLASGRLPHSIDELVPRFLGAVPVDPFDGQPMRFIETDKGIVVYSIAENGVDDGGLVARQKKRPYVRDVGFRLFRLKERGLLLVDERKEEGD